MFLQRCLIWASKFRRGSNLTPRFVTNVDRGMCCPENVIQFMVDVLV